MPPRTFANKLSGFLEGLVWFNNAGGWHYRHGVKIGKM